MFTRFLRVSPPSCPSSSIKHCDPSPHKEVKSTSPSEFIQNPYSDSLKEFSCARTLPFCISQRWSSVLVREFIAPFESYLHPQASPGVSQKILPFSEVQVPAHHHHIAKSNQSPATMADKQPPSWTRRSARVAVKKEQEEVSVARCGYAHYVQHRC